MTHYQITIQHHSIASARVVEINGTLPQAKSLAAAEFVDDRLDYMICIYEMVDTEYYLQPRLLAAKTVGGDRWDDER
jgi:hypothetical protein